MGKVGLEAKEGGLGFCGEVAVGDEELFCAGHAGRELEDALVGAGTGADAFEWGDFALVDGKDGLDAEDGADQGARPADAAAALEVFEGIDGDVDGDAVHGAASGGDDFGERGSLGGGTGCFEDDEPEPEADVVGVDEVDMEVVFEGFAGDGGGVEGSGEFGGDVDGDDFCAIGAGGSVGLLESFDGGLAGAGEEGGIAKAVVEGWGCDVDAVLEGFLAEDDGEGDDDDVVGGHEVAGEVAGGVGDDANGHNCSGAYAREYKLPVRRP